MIELDAFPREVLVGRIHVLGKEGDVRRHEFPSLRNRDLAHPHTDPEAVPAHPGIEAGIHQQGKTQHFRVEVDGTLHVSNFDEHVMRKNFHGHAKSLRSPKTFRSGDNEGAIQSPPNRVPARWASRQRQR